jgi:hypothetical protein
MAKEDFSDDYIAGLLAKDARDSSIKYSSLGLEAFLPNRFVPLSLLGREILTEEGRRQIIQSLTRASYATSYAIQTLTIKHYWLKRQRKQKRG